MYNTFFGDRIAERIQTRIKLKTDKQLEDYKSNIERKNYVTKTYFDKEFSIYQELSKKLFEMVKSISIMIPRGLTSVPANEKERYEFQENNYKLAYKAYVDFQDCIDQNAPFIPEDIYDKLINIKTLCAIQLKEHENRYDVNDLRPKEEKCSYSHEAYMRTGEIKNMYDALVKDIRSYLKTLEIY